MYTPLLEKRRKTVQQEEEEIMGIAKEPIYETHD